VVRLARERAQAHIVYGFAGTTFVDPDRFALEVLSTTLAGQSGRLFLELRDRQSLAYSVTAVSVEGLEPGYFGVYIGTSPEKVDAALAGVQLELERLCREPPSDDEIDRTKRLLIGSHEIGLQRVGARASVMAFNELYNIGHEAHLDYADRIDAVTRDDLLRVAQRTLRLDRSVLAIVGPDGCGGPVANVDVAADVDLEK
jgi:zinc protease